jgi:hypothetical protein
MSAITKVPDADVPESLRELVAANSAGAYVFT